MKSHFPIALFVGLIGLNFSYAAFAGTIVCQRGHFTYEVPQDVCASFGGKVVNRDIVKEPSSSFKTNIPNHASEQFPEIHIAPEFDTNKDTILVHGRASGTAGDVLVFVEGLRVKVSSSGDFQFKRYVPKNGLDVLVEAIDRNGNRIEKTVHLTRTTNEISEQATFANLDPTKVKGKINRDAVALIIGVSNYDRAPAADYADDDASVFSDYAYRALGIPQNNVKVLTNREATLTSLKINIKQWLRGRIEEGKTDVYVFYAGHGLASPNGEELYLLPSDGVTSLLEDTSLKRNELFSVIAKAKPRSATVFLDTCFSGLSRKEETLIANARPILISPKQQSMPNGFTVFSAASGQQISSSLDEVKHGLFSYYLMKGMEGPADANSDRMITAGELNKYVQGKVKQQAIRLGREQVPELQGDTQRVLVRW